MHPKVKTTKSNNLIPPTYDTTCNFFTPSVRASFSTPVTKDTSMVLESCHDSIFFECQSMTAVKYTNPFSSFIYVISVLHTLFILSITI